MMNSKLLSKGYKQTKVGLVPKDWTERQLVSLIEEKVIHCNDKTIGMGSLTIKSGVIPKPAQYEREHLVKDTTNAYKIIEQDDFVYNPMNLRFGALALYKNETPLRVSTYYNIFNIDENIVNIDYIYAYLKSERIMFYYNRMATGSLDEKKRVHFKEFKKFIFPFPLLKEQQKIAKILSTWDNAIEKQEQLIEQKGLLKKGLMERLLSGEVRFFEFKDKWKTVQVSEKFSFIKTYQNSRKDLADTGEVEYLHYGDIHTKYKYHLNFNKSKLPKISFNKFKTTIEYVKEGDLFIADASEDYADIGKSVEAVNIKDKKVVSGLHTFLLRNKDKSFVNGYKGLIFYNQEIRQKIKKIATGTSVLSISKTNLGKVEIPLPSQKEQHKIAQTLILANKEIALLKDKLSELKNQKKALMQKLLTGEVRVRV